MLRENSLILENLVEIERINLKTTDFRFDGNIFYSILSFLSANPIRLERKKNKYFLNSQK
jgi:hypothetical protein